MTVSGLLTNREAERIALEVLGPPGNIADRLLSILRVHLVLGGKPSDVKKRDADRILEEAAKLAAEEAQP